VYYIQPDQLGTPRTVTDTQGNLVWQYDNADPFGNNAPNENPSNQGAFHFNLRFPGQYYDTETNLAYNVNRDYDASIGRYVESDPIGLGGGVNTYTYVGGNAVAYVDRIGLCRIDVRFAHLQLNWYHAYIVTTDPDGSQTYFRGGPSTGGPSGGPLGQVSSASGGSSGGSSGSDASGASNSSNSSSPGSGRGGAGENNGPWGPIVTDTGAYVPGTVDYEEGTPPTMNILNDDKPCSCDNDKFAKTLQDINNAQIPYNPFSTNSNATAREVLERNGFNPSTPPVWAPGWNTKLPR
jgi:RHS repeat-associated protein